jgi:flavin-dependent dehydrogenase
MILLLVLGLVWLPTQEGLMGTPKATVPSIDGATQAAATLLRDKKQPMKVLIVGAGAAGMHAAYLFEHLGVDYQVLEAYHDFGGRIRQMDDFIDDLPLDMGPEWIHVDPKVLKDLLLPCATSSSMDIVTMDYQPQTGLVYSKGALYRRDWMRKLYKEYKF